MSYLDGLPQVDRTKKAGTVGFDIGAAYGFIAARALPDRIGAVAAIHPLAIATARPNSPHLFVNRSKAAYYVAFAKNDDEREPGDKTDVTKAFGDAGLMGTVVVLPGDHGFGLADNAAYDAASSEKAWSATLALLAALK
jgi:carboxymethylenebutenolidase